MVDIPFGVAEESIDNNSAPDISSSIPLITESNQGSTYAPDQLVIIFVEGFQPDEALSISAIHETEGVVKSGNTETNERGEALIYHFVQHNPSDEGAYPQGAITFQVRSSMGLVKTYTFTIDYSLIPHAAEMACGTYPPSPIQIGGAFVAWCSGFDKSEHLHTNYQTTYSIFQSGNPLLSDQADVMADGLGILILNTEPGDPDGIWDIQIGDQFFQIEVIK